MTGSGGGAAGIDPERVAELIVTTEGPGPDRRGSGYRITAEAVLTAAHVVRDEAGVRVRFDADRLGEWVADGRVAWSDPEIDVAVVAIDPRLRHDAQVEPVGFGRVAERDAVLSCSVMGFPLFKLRDDPPSSGGGPSSRYRDSAHAVGTIAVLSNRREGTLEVSVPAPERDPDPAVSPWGGMSGAAVWSAGSVVGLVAEHHRADGLGRLAATRVDRWYERLSPTRLDQLRRFTGLPATAEELREAVPPTESELVEAGYHAQVRDIGP
ncbi:MAG TPA: serine protease [Actinomycetota bacterium]